MLQSELTDILAEIVTEKVLKKGKSQTKPIIPCLIRV